MTSRRRSETRRRSSIWVICSALRMAIATWLANVRSRSSSSRRNGPPRLFSTCTTAMISPSASRTGRHRIVRVR